LKDLAKVANLAINLKMIGRGKAVWSYALQTQNKFESPTISTISIYAHQSEDDTT
jgi:hypothetical protein